MTGSPTDADAYVRAGVILSAEELNALLVRLGLPVPNGNPLVRRYPRQPRRPRRRQLGPLTTGPAVRGNAPAQPPAQRL